MDILTHIPAALIERFRASPAQTAEEISRANWRSVACMSCGACCCSVVPVGEADFNAFYARLNPAMSRQEFARRFLADPETLGVNHTLATAPYGGRCMFLSKAAYFRCDVWDGRLEVCREFFCWEMTNFAKWLAGETQGTFSNDRSWMENFDLLLTKVKTESPLSFFADDMRRYLTLLAREDAPSHYQRHRDEFFPPVKE